MKDIITTNYKESQQNKIFYIMRGCAGSGKSTLAKQLAGNTGEIFASDDFFMEDGKYNFNASKLGTAHQWNYNRIRNAIDRGVSPVIADNTNVTHFDLKSLKPLVEYAIKNGYAPRIEETKTPWAFDADELFKRNTHGVPLETIQKKIQQWVPNPTIDDILNEFKKKEEIKPV